MDNQSTPPPVPMGQTAEASPLVFPLTEAGKKNAPQWSLTILPTHLTLADAPDARPYVILREQLMKSVVFMEGMRVLAVQQPRKVNLKLTPEGAKALADWLGKPFLASFYMNRRYKMVLPWALLWVVASLMSLMPVPGSRITTHFDAVAFVLGGILLASWGIAKWRPHPTLFLVDAVWFFGVAVRLTLNVFTNDRSKGWLILAVLLAWSAVTGIRHFFRFRGTPISLVRP